MGSLAATLLEVTRNHANLWERWAPVVGASFFVLSDTFIAIKKFYLPEAAHQLHYVTITTYWIAQVLLTWGAIKLKFDHPSSVPNVPIPKKRN